MDYGTMLCLGLYKGQLNVYHVLLEFFWELCFVFCIDPPRGITHVLREFSKELRFRFGLYTNPKQNSNTLGNCAFGGSTVSIGLSRSLRNYSCFLFL